MSEDEMDEHDVSGPTADDAEIEALEALVTFLQLRHVPTPWLEAVEGQRPIEEAARLAREAGDPEALEEQSKALFSPLPELDRARLRRDLVKQFSNPSSRRWTPVWLTTIAAAAMVLLTVSWPRGPGIDDGTDTFAEAEPLVARYSLELRGQAPSRSSTEPPAGTTELTEGLPFELRLHPDEATTQEIELRLFGRPAGGDLRHLPLPEGPQELAGGGRVLSLEPDAVGLTPGTWELLVVVGARGAVTDDPSAYADPSNLPDGVQQWQQTVRVHAAPGTTTARIELGGCLSIGPWPCVVEPGSTLTLWVGGRIGKDAEIRINDQALEVQPHAMAEATTSFGARFSVPIPAVETQEYRQLATGAPSDTHWRLSVEHPASKVAQTFPLTVGAQIKRDTIPEPVLDELREHWTQARDAGDRTRWDDALRHRLAGMRLAKEHRYWSHALRNGLSAVSLARRLERHEQAARVLDEVALLSDRAPFQRGHLRYEQGVQARRGGQITLAAQHLLEATRTSLGIGDQELAAGALPEFIYTLIDLGQYAQANQWIGTAAEMSQEYAACPRSSMLHNLGWASFLLEQLGERDTRVAPTTLLERSLRVSESSEGCSVGHEQTSTRITLAQMKVSVGAFDEARHLIDRLDPAAMTALQRLFLAETGVEIALARDPGHARRQLETLEEAAADYSSSEADWRLARAGARVAEAEGNIAAAIDAYQDAEDQLDRMVGLWALGAKHDLFTAQRFASAQGLVRLLVENEEPDQALCAARRSRARSLWAAIPAKLDPEAQRRLDALRSRYAEDRASQDSYGRLARTLPTKRRKVEVERLREHRRQLEAALRTERERLGIEPDTPQCARMREPHADELILMMFPVDDGWVLFAKDRHRSRVEPLGSADPHEAGQRLLVAFDEMIEQARSVRVIATGATNEVPVHVLPWRGRPLMASKAVVYAADLPHRDAAPTPPSKRAVLIDDPTGTLSAQSAPELDHAARSLEGAGWTVTRLARDDVSLSTVTDALREVDLLHFAGHGDVDPGVVPGWPTLAGGAPGWSTYLDLGDGGQLDVNDVLDAPAVPETVVLSSCKTGLMDSRAHAGGMSMAMAFLLRGSERVVAATDDIDNLEARRAIDALYRSGALFGTATVDPGAESSAWRELRIWVR